MSAESKRAEILLLGADHGAFDTYTLRVQRSGSTVCSLSAGSSAHPARSGKKHNEDALLVVDEDASTLLAVCDAHDGHESSHELLERLSRLAQPLPPNPIALLELLAEIGDPEETARYASETTLVAAIWDRSAEAGFGVSFGDSSVMVVGLDGPLERSNRKTTTYVTPCVPSSLRPQRATEFGIKARSGQLLVAFSDGIDECHYRKPDTSVQPRHLEDILIRSGADPERFVRGLTELALAGVDGNPGGQDNIALVATRA